MKGGLLLDVVIRKGSSIFQLFSCKNKRQLSAWSEVCDSHLLAHLTQKKGNHRGWAYLVVLYFALVFTILALAGPSWHKYPVATYKPIQPRVLVLDLSQHMMEEDLSPNRLSRAKFKLQDLFAKKGLGQFGLVVYTGEPFVASPLTDDGQTISSLLSVLTPDIMPVAGQNLESALQEANNLIHTAGYHHGQILVLTADSPSSAAIDTAKQLERQGISSSIMPVTASLNLNPLFHEFAKAGAGQVVVYTSDSSDIESWLKNSNAQTQMALNTDDGIPLWRDEGRWFLIPALVLLLPAFRRGWLQKVGL